jgi:hypothetical protein
MMIELRQGEGQCSFWTSSSTGGVLQVLARPRPAQGDSSPVLPPFQPEEHLRFGGVAGSTDGSLLGSKQLNKKTLFIPRPSVIRWQDQHLFAMTSSDKTEKVNDSDVRTLVPTAVGAIESEGLSRSRP